MSSYPRAAGLARAARGGRGVDRAADSASTSTRRPRSCRRSARRRRSSRSRRSRSASERLVAVPEPGYPVYERGALFAGAEVVDRAASRANGWLPGPRRVRRVGRARALLGLLPEQPDRARPRRSRSTRSSPALAREHGFLLCSDEAYSELWFDEPPVSALQVDGPDERRRLQHALEALVDDRLPLGLRVRAAGGGRRAAQPSGRPSARRRRSSSSARRSPRGRTRRTSRRSARSTGASARRSSRARSRGTAARRRRRDVLPLARGRGPSETFARRLLEHGILVAPGSFFGPAGEGYVRLALVPTQAECERARATIARGRCCDARGDDRGARPRRAARRRAATATAGSSTPGSRRRSSLLPRRGRWRRSRSGRSSTTTRSRSSATTTALGVRVVPPAVARYGASSSPASS